MKNTSETQLAVQNDTPLSVQQVLGQVQLIQQIMQTAMQENVHFGRIPGCGDKPTLLKPGAEKLCLTFRMAPTYDVKERLLDGGHREYSITCTLTSILTGNVLGQGVGFGSTMESKYRFRKGEGEPTDKPVPRAYWDLKQEDPAKAQELIGGKGFSVKKVNGAWMIAKGGGTVENDNPANETNTVLKMSKKRALVDAVLTATAASDLMTQDLEDIAANMGMYAPTQAAETPKPKAPVVEVQEADKPSWEDQPTAPRSDFRETRIHFGKNRGLMLAELTPQQIHWYQAEWLPKKEVNGPTSVEDLALVNALKDYSEWQKNNKWPMTFLQESTIRTNASIWSSRKSLAAILNISPSAAAEVAVHGGCNEEEYTPTTAHQLFTAWADSTNTHEKV